MSMQLKPASPLLSSRSLTYITIGNHNVSSLGFVSWNLYCFRYFIFHAHYIQNIRAPPAITSHTIPRIYIHTLCTYPRRLRSCARPSSAVSPYKYELSDTSAWARKDDTSYRIVSSPLYKALLHVERGPTRTLYRPRSQRHLGKGRPDRLCTCGCSRTHDVVLVLLESSGVGAHPPRRPMGRHLGEGKVKMYLEVVKHLQRGKPPCDTFLDSHQKRGHGYQTLRCIPSEGVRFPCRLSGSAGALDE